MPKDPTLDGNKIGRNRLARENKGMSLSEPLSLKACESGSSSSSAHFLVEPSSKHAFDELNSSSSQALSFFDSLTL